MTDLNATVVARIDTSTGVAFGIRLEGGRIEVGNVVGIYTADDKMMPTGDAKVREVRYAGRGSVPGVANNAHNGSSMFASVYLDGDPAIRVGQKLGPTYAAVATRFGIEPDEIL